ncbi:MAG: hypothetical protein HZC25_00960 [Rhodospirillales bacterium]|nr:hypothetical protein [Rhodospirillales bacterium]
MKIKQKLQPWVVVQDLAEARLALRLAARRGLAVGLLSPPDCARIHGAPWFLHLIDLAGARRQGALRDHALDCANAPGLALEALRHGAATIILKARPNVFAKVAEIAAKQGARLIARRPSALAKVEAAALVAYYDRFKT